ncbi:hypothetical protein HDU98_012202, partial [Podochytrium sp. JEL0797]
MTEQVSIPNEAQLRTEWTETQARLKQQLVAHDQLSFNPETLEGLNYVAGVDVSFYNHSEDHSPDIASDTTETAVVCLAILSFPSLNLVHQITKQVSLPIPYIPGFLAMRECPAVLAALQDLETEFPAAWPLQLLFVDGNGVFHPRGFGVACQVGVEARVPTIGVAKNLLEIPGDGVLSDGVKRICVDALDGVGKWVRVCGDSGIVYGAAVRACEGAKNPVFVSGGHLVSLETSVKVTLA